MYSKGESYPGRSIGNALIARRAGPGTEGGPKPRYIVEKDAVEPIGWATEGRAGASPGDAMRSFYRDLGVRSILLVEDDPWTRDSLSLFFQVEGCRLRSAASADEAIAALLGDRFDLVICEYWLPDMDGLSVLKLYGDCQPGAVKVLISAYLTHQAVDEAMRSGIDDVIRKPFKVETLENSLRRHFEARRGRGGVSVETC